MPTNRTRRTRNSKPKDLPDNIRLLLETGQGPKGDLETFMIEGSRDRLKTAWERYRDEIMGDWIRQNPCSRPWGWWRFDAPENRRRVGGFGQPDFEVLAYGPDYERGVPSGWITQDDVETFGPDFKGIPYDRHDPPRYESESSYLQRLNLLISAEQKWLSKHPEGLEPERVEDD
jgi:hypothetical protein